MEQPVWPMIHRLPMWCSTSAPGTAESRTIRSAIARESWVRHNPGKECLWKDEQAQYLAYQVAVSWTLQMFRPVDDHNENNVSRDAQYEDQTVDDRCRYAKAKGSYRYRFHNCGLLVSRQSLHPWQRHGLMCFSVYTSKINIWWRILNASTDSFDILSTNS